MQRVVGISEMLVSVDASDVLVTYSLGSCIGVALYDPVARVGGLLHAMMPLSTLNPEKARTNPQMFTDTGTAAILQAAFDRGATRNNLIVKVSGASAQMDGRGLFKIGERNYTVLRRVLWKNDLLIAAEDVGGIAGRTMYLDMNTGMVRVQSNGQAREL